MILVVLSLPSYYRVRAYQQRLERIVMLAEDQDPDMDAFNMFLSIAQDDCGTLFIHVRSLSHPLASPPAHFVITVNSSTIPRRYDYNCYRSI